jgi:hypothetical protein
MKRADIEFRDIELSAVEIGNTTIRDSKKWLIFSEYVAGAFVFFLVQNMCGSSEKQQKAIDTEPGKYEAG